MNQAFTHTAVVGAGAVGSYYGAMLARAGHRVTLIGRPAHVQAMARGGLQLHKGGRVEAVRVDASSELAAARDADLVLFCVKSTDTEAVARELASHLREGAVVMSLQNGVDNAPALARALTGHTIVPAAVYVATAMPEPGTVQHFGRGELVIGPLKAALGDDAAQLQLEALVALFAGADVPVTISADVMAELWSKLLVNCAYNAISALAQLPYGVMASVPEVVELQRAVVREVVAVARADAVQLDLEASLQAMARIAATMPAQHSSTAQDLARGKRSEIDHLNGTVVRRGAAHGVPTPANQALLALVKLVEAGAGESAAARP
jgi:2-dehydropantoate 2-reductase